VRIVAIDIDSPGQHAAMIEKLDLPFPYLSDPDRSQAIAPYDLVDAKDARDLARPAMILVGTDGEERFRFVSRDFADRYPEDGVLEAATELGLPPTTPEPMHVGTPEPGPHTMPFDGLWYYLRGARYAALAMGLRHKDLGESIKDDSKAYVATMDRMLEHIKEYTKRRNVRSGS
jgi:hypothetical protein